MDGYTLLTKLLLKRQSNWNWFKTNYQNPNITINIGGNEFGRIAAEEINKAQRRAGTCVNRHVIN